MRPTPPDFLALRGVIDVDRVSERGYVYGAGSSAGAMMATCTKDHTGSVPRAVANLPKSQGGEWRHGCPACAYELGWRDAQTAEENLRKRVRELEARLHSFETSH